jgi:outer membrane protein
MIHADGMKATAMKKKICAASIAMLLAPVAAEAETVPPHLRHMYPTSVQTRFHRDAGMPAYYAAPAPQQPAQQPYIAQQPVAQPMPQQMQYTAQDVAAGAPQQPAKRDWNLSLGAGGMLVPDYEGSDDYEVNPIPVLIASYRDIVAVQGPALSLNAVALVDENLGRSLKAGPVIGYRGGRDEDDNSALTGLGDVDPYAELGGYISYQMGPIGFSAKALQDVTGAHDGLRAEFETSYRMPLMANLMAGISVSASYADDDYMGAYFSITPAQSAKSGYAVYSAKSGFKDVGVGANLNYMLDENWGVFLRGGFKRLLGDAVDSPIVKQQGSANQANAAFGISYRF